MKFQLLCKLILLSFVSFMFSAAQGQIQFDFGFQRDQTIEVFNTQNQKLKNPWVGGFNTVHFNATDLNMDGIKDLVVFDTQRDRLMTFVNGGTPGTVDYTYAPEYEKYFPKITSWIRMVDYNNDGKEDIFTYGYTGIKVYKNTSTVTGGLSFSLYSPNLLSNQGGVFPGNIQVSEVDYPAFADADGDGDIDLLVFAGLGSTIELHRNYAKDSTGTTDTIWLALRHRCWGWFSEDPDNNVLIMNIQQDTNIAKWCQYGLPYTSAAQKKPRHAGSTLLLLDLNGNNIMDLILGDTDYPTLIGVINGGTADSAHATAQIVQYPQSDTPVFLYSLVNTDYLDVNNDGKKDLLAGSFNPGWYYPKNLNIKNVWWYKNTGTNSFPDFKLQTREFLTDGIIDAGSNSHPVLFDYDNDGLLDLFIGNYGYLDSAYMDPWATLHTFHRASVTLYRNTGNLTQPEFTLITKDFANVSSLNLTGAYPTFGDLNGDGKPDMVLGDSTGKLHYFQNVAPAGQPMQLNYVTGNYQGIDVGQYAIPQLFDLDKDGLPDLVIGYKDRIWTADSVNWVWRTSLSYYRNTGSAAAPQFTHITDSLGGVSVNDSYFHYTDGYSAPCFYRDTTGTTYLFVGSGPGFVFYYRDIDGNLAGVFGKDSNMYHTTDYDLFYSVQHFENEDHNPVTIDAKLKSAVTLGDLNGDGYPEMIVGNWAGGLHFYKGSKPLGVGIEPPAKDFTGEVKLYPNPASGSVTIEIQDGDRSMQVHTSVFSITGQMLLQQQQTGDDHFRLDATSLPEGVYLVRIKISSPFQGTTGLYHRKLVIKR
ncbi:MAG TPA: T9SS type A sorting domain-containing protein [Bacteroidales bacterium]|nr:T9SS type A sorting domain-containing protein [Bacteroidales bacterium]